MILVVAGGIKLVFNGHVINLNFLVAICISYYFGLLLKMRVVLK
jgi:hypothetical protein